MEETGGGREEGRNSEREKRTEKPHCTSSL